MPDPDRMPMTFMRYVNYLNEEHGPEEASKRIVDYMRNNAIQSMKSEMVPSL